MKLIYVNLHKQYALRVKMTNYGAYRSLVSISHLPNITKEKMDKINLLQILSKEVMDVLNLAKPPSHFFTGQGVPLHTIDEIMNESRSGAIFCQNSLQFRKDYIQRRTEQKQFIDESILWEEGEAESGAHDIELDLQRLLGSTPNSRAQSRARA